MASLFQVLIGYSGMLGILLKYITPLTIGPSVAMIGLSLFDVASMNASKHWGISVATIALMILFSQYLEKAWIPVPTCSKGKSFKKFKIFTLFPVLLTILIMWGICGILTLADVEDTNIRVDGEKMKMFRDATWFRVPYPCKL